MQQTCNRNLWPVGAGASSHGLQYTFSQTTAYIEYHAAFWMNLLIPARLTGWIDLKALFENRILKFELENKKYWKFLLYSNKKS